MFNVRTLTFGERSERIGFVLEAAGPERFKSTVAVRPDQYLDTGDLFSITVHVGESGHPAVQVFITDDDSRMEPVGLAFPAELADGIAWRHPTVRHKWPVLLGSNKAVRCPELHDQFRKSALAIRRSSDPMTAIDFLRWLRASASLPSDLVKALNEVLSSKPKAA